MHWQSVHHGFCIIALFCCCHVVVLLLAPSGHYVICQKLFSPPALQQEAARTQNTSERFLWFDEEPEVETQMIRVLIYHHQVCFVITRLPHNKCRVLHGETDKHFDKLNKALTHTFWDCIFIFGSSKMFVQGSWLVCLSLCKRFVDLVKKTNYILTLLRVFVFVLPACRGVELPLTHPLCRICRVSLSFWGMKMLCVYSPSHASQMTNEEETNTLKISQVDESWEFYFWLVLNNDFAKVSFFASIVAPCHFVFVAHVWNNII